MTSEVKHVALVWASVRCLTFLLPELPFWFVSSLDKAVMSEFIPSLGVKATLSHFLENQQLRNILNPSRNILIKWMKFPKRDHWSVQSHWIIFWQEALSHLERQPLSQRLKEPLQNEHIQNTRIKYLLIKAWVLVCFVFWFSFFSFPFLIV